MSQKSVEGRPWTVEGDKKKHKQHNAIQEVKSMAKDLEDVEWSYATIIDLKKSPKSKIAFLSGMERPYFPEQPGHDRFGIAYTMNNKRTDISHQPNSFIPGRFGLTKPISTKGYGIGGLLGPRFTKDVHGQGPGPGTYQPEVSLPVDDFKSHISEGEIKNSFDYKMQRIYSFGSHLTVNRFGSEPLWRSVGVGYYDLKNAGVIPRIPVNDGFRGGPAFIKPSPLTYCNYEKCDECFECGIELKICDYYKSKGVIRLPTRITKNKKDLTTADDDDDEDAERKRNIPRILAICRACYCKAMKGKHKSWGWTPDYLLWMFQKARYCGYIHEHHQLPITLHKTTSKLVEKLNRKEAVMRKHYHDACERTLKQKAKAKL